MDDTISRQAAIDALHMHLMYRMGTDSNKKRLDDWINGLPSAQPETHEERTETHACDLISRQAAIDAIDEIESEVADGDGFQYDKWRRHFCDLPSAEPESCEYWDAESNYCALNRPSAQPEPEEFEWCTGCKEYDQEAHCCHRWTKAIRNTVEEIKNAQPEPRWIPVTQQLPEIGEKVLVSTKYTVFTQVFKRIYGTPDRWGWEHNTIKKVTAWMPLPMPWRGEADV